jgi:hypothetical protein
VDSDCGTKIFASKCYEFMNGAIITILNVPRKEVSGLVYLKGLIAAFRKLGWRSESRSAMRGSLIPALASVGK